MKDGQLPIRPTMQPSPQKLTQNNTSKKNPKSRLEKLQKTKNQCKNVTTFLKHGFDGIQEARN
jgi:hypothetical protein